MQRLLAYLLLGLSPGLFAYDAQLAAPRDAEVMAHLNQFNQTVDPATKALKYCKMQSSPYLFYRGSNTLYWQDWYNNPALNRFKSAQTQIWLQADLHADNYGAYADSQGRIIYDLNDFDESFIADYQYDLLRMATSLYLIAAQQQLSKADKAVSEFADYYLAQLQALEGNDQEQSLIFTAENTKGALDNFLEKVAKKKSRAKMLADWTTTEAGQRHFKSDQPDLAAVDADVYQALAEAMQAYPASTTLITAEQFKIKDIAKRLHAGTGSLGTARYYVLIAGDNSDQSDDHILDIKQQAKVSAWAYLSTPEQLSYDRRYPNAAARHAAAYKALTQYTDRYLGWFHWAGADYSVRERSAYKKTFAISELNKNKALKKMARQWGAILATAHARADIDAKDGMIAYSFEAGVSQVVTDHKAFRKHLQALAREYAQQVMFDYHALKQGYSADCAALLP